MNVDALAQDKTPDEHPGEPLAYHPYVFFRIHEKYLALSALLIKEITTLRTMHRLPYMKVPFIEGVVNVNGRLRVLISLQKLLQLPKAEEIKPKRGTSLVLVEKEQFAWTFLATEVLGMLHVTPESIQPLPEPTMTTTAHYMKGLFLSEKGLVGLLDEELLFLRLRHHL